MQIYFAFVYFYIKKNNVNTHDFKESENILSARSHKNFSDIIYAQILQIKIYGITIFLGIIFNLNSKKRLD